MAPGRKRASFIISRKHDSPFIWKGFNDLCLASSGWPREHNRMKRPRLLKFRIVISVAVGVFLLIESTNSSFLKPAEESHAIFVHIFVALLGAAFLAQAAILGGKVTRKTVP
jgi:hypothetical protein